MTRTELAAELNTYPWEIDGWLLRGCPAKRTRTLWDFDPEKVKNWLKSGKIKVHRLKGNDLSKRPVFDPNWLGKRCPICIQRGFPGEKAGRVYTMGEILEGEWHLRRTGIPCGHSIFLPAEKIAGSAQRKAHKKSAQREMG